MDVFNVFNFQEIAAIDERYTRVPVAPIVDGKPAANGEPDPAQIRRTGTNPGDFDPETDRNPNYGNPTAYQAPRTFRFGMRVTF
jgi:hypothetical protein